MSVINQMLKDLDKRQASSPVRARSPVVRRGSQRLMWLALVAAVLIFLVFGLPQYQKKPPRIIDTPGHKEPKIIVLRPGEPTSAAPSSGSVANSGVAAATPNTAVTAQPSAAQLASTQVPSTQAASTLAASVPAPELPPPALTAGAANSSIATTVSPQAQQLPATLTPVTMPVTEPVTEPSNAQPSATLPETLQVATLDTNQSFPALVSSRDAVPSAVAPAKAPTLSIERVGPKTAVPSSLLQQANDAMHAGNWPRASQLWAQIQRQQPSQALAYEQLADIFYAQRDTAALTQLLEQARQQGVSSHRLQLAQLRLLAATRQWQVLLDTCTPELEQQGGAVLSIKAQAQQQLGLLDAAVRTYQQWQQLEPQQARAFLGEALVQEQQGHQAAAQQAYQQALQRGGLAADTVSFIEQRLKQGAHR